MSRWSRSFAAPVIARVVAACSLLPSLACERGETTPPTTADAPTAGVDGSPTDDDARFSYPDAERSDHVDRYHGISVADPYRWLEDLDAPATREWIDAQNTVTFGYLDNIEARTEIRERLTALWNYERWGTPSKQGKRFIASKNDGLQPQSVLYKLDSLDDPGTVLLDPNKLSSDGTVALSGRSFSPDGKLMAYGVSDSGSDWQVWRVRTIDTAEDTMDLIQWIKFTGVSWTKDNKGFFYARYDEPKGEHLADINEGQKLYYHRLGTPQAEDPLIYSRDDHPKWGFAPKVTDDGRYLVITVRIGTERNNSILVQDLTRRGTPLAKDGSPHATVELRPGFSAHWDFVGSKGTKFWFRTDEGAPRSRVVEIDLNKPEQTREVVGESKDTLVTVELVADRFIASYLSDAHAKLQVFETNGKLAHDVALPGIGSIRGIRGEPDDDEAYLSFSSFTIPATAHRLDPKTGKLSVWRAPKVAFDPGNFVVKQVFYESKDGTKIPMFLAHKKGVEPTKAKPLPTYLYGYGGFSIPVTPRFSVPDLVWMEMGGLYASANLRGGGEYGEAWHRAGIKLDKQNVFDDFVSAAEYLVEQGWTSTDKLAIGGRSNGGLLVGATITQRPDLFAAALPGVGVMDMLRFDEFTIGWAWTHRLRQLRERARGVSRPCMPTRRTTTSQRGHGLPRDAGLHGRSRMTAWSPAHSYKFAARAPGTPTTGDPTPVMIRIDTKAGHGAGKPTEQAHRGVGRPLGLPRRQPGHDAALGASATRQRRTRAALGPSSARLGSLRSGPRRSFATRCRHFPEEGGGQSVDVLRTRGHQHDDDRGRKRRRGLDDDDRGGRQQQRDDTTSTTGAPSECGNGIIEVGEICYAGRSDLHRHRDGALGDVIAADLDDDGALDLVTANVGSADHTVALRARRRDLRRAECAHRRRGHPRGRGGALRRRRQPRSGRRQPVHTTTSRCTSGTATAGSRRRCPWGRGSGRARSGSRISTAMATPTSWCSTRTARTCRCCSATGPGRSRNRWSRGWGRSRSGSRSATWTVTICARRHHRQRGREHPVDPVRQRRRHDHGRGADRGRRRAPQRGHTGRRRRRRHGSGRRVLRLGDRQRGAGRRGRGL